MMMSGPFLTGYTQVLLMNVHWILVFTGCYLYSQKNFSVSFILAFFLQTINDWYDRDIDAINEPYRPIPSGAISEQEVGA